MSKDKLKKDDLKKIRERVERLRRQIDDLRYRYHVLNDPIVTDAMYDPLMVELKKLEADFPEFQDKNSPSQRVAGVPLDKFEKTRHVVRQWSFEDAFDEEDLADWEERNLKILEKALGGRPTDLSYCVELKIDGLHIVLTYESGELVLAATRGDGEVGENVTQNIRTIKSVPLRLTRPVSLVAEGEVWLSVSGFKKLNLEREQSDEPLFANPRNAAAGTIRQLDPLIVAKRGLALTVYDISGGPDLPTQISEIETLSELGFLTEKRHIEAKNLGKVLDFWREVRADRDKMPFWIDGVVVKVNQKKYQDILGYTGKSPRFAIALKFPAEQGTAKILEVYVQVGRTGTLTPVARLTPVSLAGTVVTRATLHNFDEIDRLGVLVGDTVVVEKAGDIIPKIVRVLEHLRDGTETKINLPKTCPICGSSVARREISQKKKNSSAALFCVNDSCYGQEIERLSHFVGRGGFEIDGLGEKIIAQLVGEGLIKDAADLFRLKISDLLPLERFAEKSAVNLVESIEKAKDIILPKFIFALGIKLVGEETAIRLAEHFREISRLFDATIEDFQAVPDIGPRVAESLRDFFAKKQNRELISEMLSLGIKIRVYEGVAKSKALAGKSAVITGTLSGLSREEAEDLVRALGGKVSSSVSKQTSFVVAGEKAGSKLDRALELGIEIKDAEWLRNLAKKEGLL